MVEDTYRKKDEHVRTATTCMSHWRKLHVCCRRSARIGVLQVAQLPTQFNSLLSLLSCRILHKTRAWHPAHCTQRNAHVQFYKVLMHACLNMRVCAYVDSIPANPEQPLQGRGRSGHTAEGASQGKAGRL